MSTTVNWIKTHKAQTALILIGAYFGWQFIQSFFGISLRQSAQSRSNLGMSGYGAGGGSSFGAIAPSVDLPSLSETGFTMEKRSDTSTTPTERMVVQNSNLSLLVKDVKETGDKILKYTKDTGGFMVSTSYNRPNESPFATITIRIPSERFDETLNYLRSLALKVTNENLVGTDVTEQYEDIEAKLDTLEKTKAKFLIILAAADDVNELLKVQKEIINLQTQIDALKGRKQAIEREVAMAKITVYLSTDELSLPYTPDTKFRPNVVFKLAVRSLLNTLRMIGTAVIWVGVYSAIWIPALILILLYKRFKKGKSPKVQA